MREVSLNALIEQVARYNLTGISKITKAYEFAQEKHKGQYRASGEEYIVHPLAVAIILARLHADCDTICAGLLHDVVEDTNTTLDEIKDLFGNNVATLVNGVTNLTKMSFNSKTSFDNANLRKVILGMSKDVRIIIIKISDRLHNMLTLQYKEPEKRKEKALETMEIYVPIAQYLGLYNIKRDLEDQSFKFLRPNDYAKVQAMKNEISTEIKGIVQEVIETLDALLRANNLPSTIKFRLKGAYAIFKDTLIQKKTQDIHDLMVFTVILDTVNDCYLALRYIHKLYKPVNQYFRDYICSPKINNYQAIHSTVVGPDDRFMQMQNKTADMEKISKYGITDFWHADGENSSMLMQEALYSQYPFFQSIIDANKLSANNREFVEVIKGEVFAEKIEVYTKSGRLIEVTKGITVVDFAYLLHTEIGNKMVTAVVNGKVVPLDYELNPDDRIKIVTDDNAEGPTLDWLNYVKTAKAKKKIKEFLNKKNRDYLLVRIP